MSKQRKKRKKNQQQTELPGRVIDGLLEIENLLDAEEYSQVGAIVRSLQARYPKVPEVWLVAQEYHFKTGDVFGCMRDWEALVVLDRGNPEYGFALAGACLNAGMMTLALRHFRRCLQRWPDNPEADKARDAVVEIERAIDHAMSQQIFFGSDAFDQLCLHEEIQVHLHAGEYGRVHLLVEQFVRRNPNVAAVFNNDADAWLQQGRIDRAITSTERALEIQPDNFHALSNLARFQFLAGEMEEAQRTAARLLEIDSENSSIWAKKAEALTIVGNDQAVVELWDRVQPFLNRIEPTSAALICHLAAVALWRVGRQNAARAAWRQSLKTVPAFTLAIENLNDLELDHREQNGPWAYGIARLIPRSTVESLSASIGDSKKEANSNGQQFACKWLREHPDVEGLLPVLLERGDPFGRAFALLIATEARTPRLLEALLAFAEGRYGTQKQRMTAARVAFEAGLLMERKFRLWDKNEFRDVTLMNYEIHAESVHSLPDECTEDMETIVNLLREGNGRAAEPILRQLIERFPNYPTLQNNLAVALQMQGRIAESEAIAVSVYERFPDYLFARAAYAQLQMRDGRFAEARELLKPLWECTRFHVTEFDALCSAQIRLHEMLGEREQVNSLLDIWQQINPDSKALNEVRSRVPGKSLVRRLPGF